MAQARKKKTDVVTPAGQTGKSSRPKRRVKKQKPRPVETSPSIGAGSVGLECRKCGCRHFWVLYVRALSHGRIRRRRECRHCGWRITTVEKEQGAIPV